MDNVVITTDDVARAGACGSGITKVLARLRRIPAALTAAAALRLASTDGERSWIQRAADLVRFGYGYGYGYGDGYGYGYGYGDGYGDGDGYGYGYGYGDGDGDGYGDGDGDGNGNGGSYGD
jgi:hypothetical protein